MQNFPLFELVTLAALMVNTILSIGAFVRVGRWRDSDAGKNIAEAIQRLEGNITTDGGSTVKADIHKIRNDLTKIELRLNSSEKASDKVSAIEGRIGSIDTQIQHMASRADISDLKAQLDGVKSMVGAAEAGVARIEGYLMERSA